MKLIKTILIFGLLFILCSLIITPHAWSESPKKPAFSVESLYKAMRWRSIGPFRGGRVTAVPESGASPSLTILGGQEEGSGKSRMAG